MRRVLVLVLLAGCGRIGFGPIGAADAGDGDAVEDAADDGSVVIDAQLGMFGTPMIVTALNSVLGDDDPSLSTDLREIYFTSNRGGGSGQCDIWTARRASAGAAWNPPTNAGAVNTNACESGPTLSSDGLTLYLSNTSNDIVGGAADIFVATRPTPSGAWSTATINNELSSASHDGSPSLTDDELRVVLFSTRDGGDDLYEAVRASKTAPWGTPVRIVELNTAGRDRSPHISPNGKTIWFASDRPGGLGGQDLYMAVRPSLTQPFGAPIHVPELSTAMTEDDPWISLDGTIAFWASTGAIAELDIFTATR